MTEYSIYLVTVWGLLKLRFSTRSVHTRLEPVHYRTHILNPLIFCCVSVLIIIQSAISHIVQGLIIILFFAGVGVIYRSDCWWRLVQTGSTEVSSPR